MSFSNDLEKLGRVIESCRTEDQLVVASNMIRLFSCKYPYFNFINSQVLNNLLEKRRGLKGRKSLYAYC